MSVAFLERLHCHCWQVLARHIGSVVTRPTLVGGGWCVQRIMRPPSLLVAPNFRTPSVPLVLGLCALARARVRRRGAARTTMRTHSHEWRSAQATHTARSVLVARGHICKHMWHAGPRNCCDTVAYYADSDGSSGGPEWGKGEPGAVSHQVGRILLLCIVLLCICSQPIIRHYLGPDNVQIYSM